MIDKTCIEILANGTRCEKPARLLWLDKDNNESGWCGEHEELHKTVFGIKISEIGK